MTIKQVTRCSDIDWQSLLQLVQRFGLTLKSVVEGEFIPGSYWGESEAGLVGSGGLYVRDDTPVHSALHEACHYICMSPQRRAGLHTDAGGGYDEENAVCYLQILLSDYLVDYNRDRMMVDMDAWGYTFRLGSARQWFEQDADDALQWLTERALIDGLWEKLY